MSVKNNGDTSTPLVLSGSITFPVGASWPTGGSDNYYGFSGDTTLHTNGASTYFVGPGVYPFKGTPIVVATLSGANQTVNLQVRPYTIGADGFSYKVFNTGTSGITLSSGTGALTINWVATEATRPNEAPNAN